MDNTIKELHDKHTEALKKQLIDAILEDFKEILNKKTLDQLDGISNFVYLFK